MRILKSEAFLGLEGRIDPNKSSNVRWVQGDGRYFEPARRAKTFPRDVQNRVPETPRGRGKWRGGGRERERKRLSEGVDDLSMTLTMPLLWSPRFVVTGIETRRSNCLVSAGEQEVIQKSSTAN